jgi:hypothetical protein
MKSYKYGTALLATEDDPNERNNIEEGDVIFLPGKREEGHSYEVLTEDGTESVSFEPIEIYEAEERMSEQEASNFARERYKEEQAEKEAGVDA